MSRRGRLNLVLLGLIVVLGATALLLPEPGRDRPLPAVDIDPARLARIEIRFPRGGETLRLERDADGWRLVAPRERRANAARVARLLQSLREPTRSCYPAAEHAPAEFGLETPHAVLTLDDTRIALGDRAADGRRYLRSGGQLCLVEDVAVPMLRDGADALAPADGDG